MKHLVKISSVTMVTFLFSLFLLIVGGLFVFFQTRSNSGETPTFTIDRGVIVSGKIIEGKKIDRLCKDKVGIILDDGRKYILESSEENIAIKLNFQSMIGKRRNFMVESTNANQLGNCEALICDCVTKRIVAATEVQTAQ